MKEVIMKVRVKVNVDLMDIIDELDSDDAMELISLINDAFSTQSFAERGYDYFKRELFDNYGGRDDYGYHD